MSSRWLFGNPLERSYRIDLDTAIDVAKRFRQLRPNAEVKWWVVSEDGADVRPVKEADLHQLSQVDRGRLEIRAPEEGMTDGADPFPWSGSSTIPFRLNRSPWVSIVQDDGTIAALLHKIIADNGRVRLIRRRIRWRSALRAYWLPILITAAWVWVAATQRLPIPVVILGSIAALFTFWVAVPTYRIPRTLPGTPNPGPHPGHYIRQETRAEKAQRSANTRRDIKVALITLPIGAALTFIVALITGNLTL